ncbi:hypothetical protein VNO77_00948 [Canavalia gladiata]|uniref:Uncharacterized protein n=1 Tax=Canavalia gladiata TaxID=3824 RepID=A0AAN9MQD4_CANGL
MFGLLSKALKMEVDINYYFFFGGGGAGTIAWFIIHVIDDCTWNVIVCANVITYAYSLTWLSLSDGIIFDHQLNNLKVLICMDLKKGVASGRVVEDPSTHYGVLISSLFPMSQAMPACSNLQLTSAKMYHFHAIKIHNALLPFSSRLLNLNPIATASQKQFT